MNGLEQDISSKCLLCRRLHLGRWTRCQVAQAVRTQWVITSAQYKSQWSGMMTNFRIHDASNFLLLGYNSRLAQRGTLRPTENYNMFSVSQETSVKTAYNWKHLSSLINVKVPTTMIDSKVMDCKTCTGHVHSFLTIMTSFRWCVLWTR